ncbi:MAG: hypothetical protein GY716_00785 [bacterium]|nr:hypothetical protein [bacterium]
MSKALCIATAAALLLAAPFATAEVSSNAGHPQPTTLILGHITDDPNPVGVWTLHRAVPLGRTLNPDGDVRIDGRPDVFIRADSGPTAVWSYNAGTDGDIAFSEWDGTQWTVTEFLTSSATNDLDPRLFVEPDGTVHVVWWTGDTDDVFLATRPATTGAWGTPGLVTPGPERGRRPSVVVSAGTILLTYERDSDAVGMAQEVVVATHTGGDTFDVEIVATTPNPGALESIIHAVAGKQWIDWIHGEQVLGCVEKDGPEWSPPFSQPANGSGWIGIEEVRREFRVGVLVE